MHTVPTAETQRGAKTMANAWMQSWMEENIPVRDSTARTESYRVEPFAP